MSASPKIIEIGTGFGSLTVISFSRTINYRACFVCKCDCGKVKEIKSEKLKAGTTRSCGCIKKYMNKINATIHGLSYTKEYKSNNVRNYLARKRAAKGSHSLEDVADLLRLQKFMCYYCGKKLNTYHVEHKIPLVRGGSNGRENICISCPKCNLKKVLRQN